MTSHSYEEKERISLDRAWLVQLAEEHERICWQYGVTLTVPLLEISASSSNWGSWHPATRTIKVSSRLITLHTWDVVLCVFKHEIAHQIVSEIFHSSEKHGPLFDRSCAMLGVPDSFRGASGDLPRTIRSIEEKAATSPQRKMLDKIEKLLALAQSHNEHESLLAMEKANRLIEKYNIRRVELSQKAHYDFIIINHKKKRIENYQRKICTILANHFFVKVILSNSYDALQCCSHKTIEIFGTTENVLIAHYVYDFLLGQMDFLWNQFRKKNNTSGRQKRSYWLGVLDGFAKKLSSKKQMSSDKNTIALQGKKNLSVMLCDQDQALGLFIEQRYPRLTRRTYASAKVHMKEYEAGHKDGKKLRLSKGVGTDDGFKGNLLNQ